MKDITLSLVKDDRYLSVLNKLNYPIVVVDNDNMLMWANRRFLTTSKTGLANIEDPESLLSFRSKLIEAAKSGEYVFKDETDLIYFQLVRSPFNHEGKRVTLISFFNISKHKRLQTELQNRERSFRQFSEHLPEGVVLSLDHIYFVNKAFERLSGHSSTELLSKKLLDMISHDEQGMFIESIDSLLLKRRASVVSELRLVNKKGRSIWVRIKTSLLKQGDRELFLNIITDISRERSEMSKLSHLAYFDALTGIYNRRKFDELLLLEYQRAKRYQRDLSGLFFDIDHFKRVNDDYGHDIGDSVLVSLAQLVQKYIRETDLFARWGGEEFIILLPETLSKDALILSEHIRDKVNVHHFPMIGNITISIGITSLKGKEQMRSFIRRLDTALYRAKDTGRDRSVML